MIAMLRRRLMGGGAKRCNVIINGSNRLQNGNYVYHPYVVIDDVQYQPKSQVQVKQGTKIRIWWFVAGNAWYSWNKNAIVENGVVLQSGAGSGLYEYTVRKDCTLTVSTYDSDNGNWGYAIWTIQA